MASERPPSRNRTVLTVLLLRRRLARVGPLFLAVFLAVATAVYVLERSAEGTHVTGFGDAVWFTVVTLSTVGYGDVFPVTVAGRLVTGGFILFTLTAIGFLLTAINDAVLEVKRMEETGLIGTDMTGHVVVCGFGPIARTAIEEIIAGGRNVALVCATAAEIDEARRYGGRDRLFVTSGEISQDLLRDRLNAAAAATAVIATDDDTVNIVAALNFRAVSPAARVIVAVRTDALRKTLIASGVTYVASPFELSGRLVASAAFEPEVARFVDDVTSGLDDGYDLHEYPATPFAGQTVREVRDRLEDLDGPLLLAVARRRGDDFEMLPHPSRDLVLAAEDMVVVLADADQARRLTEALGVRQGR